MKKIISVITIVAFVAMVVFTGIAITESPLWAFMGTVWSIIVFYFGFNVLNEWEQDDEIVEDDE